MVQVGGSSTCVGLFTSGGTESIMIAVLAYREWGISKGIAAPEIVAAISAHPALFKACHYFGVKLIKVVCRSWLPWEAWKQGAGNPGNQRISVPRNSREHLQLV